MCVEQPNSLAGADETFSENEEEGEILCTKRAER